MSLFRYGLDYVQTRDSVKRIFGFGKKKSLRKILAILRRQNPFR